MLFARSGFEFRFPTHFKFNSTQGNVFESLTLLHVCVSEWLKNNVFPFLFVFLFDQTLFFISEINRHII